MSSRSGKLLAAGGFLIALTGCGSIRIPPSAGDLSRINLGMSKSAISSQLGAPCYATGEGKEEVYHYRLVEGGQPFGETGSYYVRIVDGRVESYGKEPQAASEE